jgi:pyruvate dehydrogenase E2 component (dihydrolipoamide acetyltransferase)
MATEIYMPQLGLTMTEGTVIRWLKAEGDPVQKGELVLEIETDKVVVGIEAPADGILGPILAIEGAVVPIGQVISYVLAPGEEAPTETKAAVLGIPVPGEAETPPAAPKEAPTPRASPKARRLAEHLGVDLATVQGTGRGGRIVAADVQRAAERVGAPAPAPTPLVPPGDVEPLRGVRRVVAERMTYSFTTTPHFYLTAEVEATAAVRMREGLLSKVEAAADARLTITDILIKVVAQALEEFPEVNAAWADDPHGSAGGVLRQSQVNVGVAVAASDGLIVPVIHDADKLSLGEIARRRADVTRRARDGKLTLADLEGGTFTLSNLGMFGVDQFQAIINPPQSAILAVGRIKERPVAVAGTVESRPTMFLTLSVDHRLLDGVQAARFLQRVEQLIEQPYSLISP